MLTNAPKQFTLSSHTFITRLPHYPQHMTKEVLGMVKQHFFLTRLLIIFSHLSDGLWLSCPIMKGPSSPANRSLLLFILLLSLILSWTKLNIFQATPWNTKVTLVVWNVRTRLHTISRSTIDKPTDVSRINTDSSSWFSSQCIQRFLFIVTMHKKFPFDVIRFET